MKLRAPVNIKCSNGQKVKTKANTHRRMKRRRRSNWRSEVGEYYAQRSHTTHSCRNPLTFNSPSSRRSQRSKYSYFEALPFSILAKSKCKSQVQVFRCFPCDQFLSLPKECECVPSLVKPEFWYLYLLGWRSVRLWVSCCLFFCFFTRTSC